MKGTVRAQWEFRLNGEWVCNGSERRPASLAAKYLTVELPSGLRQRMRHYGNIGERLKIRHGFDRDPVTKLNTQRITFTDYQDLTNDR